MRQYLHLGLQDLVLWLLLEGVQREVHRLVDGLASRRRHRHLYRNRRLLQELQLLGHTPAPPQRYALTCIRGNWIRYWTLTACWSFLKILIYFRLFYWQTAPPFRDIILKWHRTACCSSNCVCTLQCLVSMDRFAYNQLFYHKCFLTYIL